MKHARTISHLQTDLKALEVSADRAGMALACMFSSADEYEADIIRSRLNAGLIGHRHVAGMRGVLAVTATAALAALLIIVA
jgi:hypothetical protein